MTYKALIIDPADPTGRVADRARGLQNLCVTNFGWEVDRLKPFWPGMNGGDWLAELWRSIEDAEIFICLGNYVALLMAGEKLDDTLDRLIAKARAGAPFLLQTEGTPETEHEARLNRLFKSFETIPTNLKVASRSREYKGHGSPLSVIFRKADYCLRDPRLFQGVEEVAIYGPRVVVHEGDAVPVIDAANASHYFIDAGDLEIALPPGVHPAPMIVRATHAELQIVISGAALNDEFQSLGGVAPSFQDNRVFAENVLKMIDYRLSARVEAETTAYAIFAKLERALGSVVEAVYPNASVRISKAPSWARKRLQEPAAGWGRADFKHICATISANWADFLGLFPGTSAREFESSYKAINSDERTYLAHPHKAKVERVEFGLEHVARLRAFYNLAREALKRAHD